MRPKLKQSKNNSKQTPKVVDIFSGNYPVKYIGQTGINLHSNNVFNVIDKCNSGY